MPTIIALVCEKREAGGVALVNLLFGWTVIGWIVAFIWSCTGKTRANNQLQAKHHHEAMLMPGKR